MNQNFPRISWLMFVSMIFLSACLAASAETLPSSITAVNVAGKWELTWQARIGETQGILKLQQNGPKLNGSFQSPLGSPSVSGTIEGQSISFKLQFEGNHPFSIAFTGKTDGHKMSGKFDLPGMGDGYDQHGENAQPTNYSWTATPLEDLTEQPQKPVDTIHAN